VKNAESFFIASNIVHDVKFAALIYNEQNKE